MKELKITRSFTDHSDELLSAFFNSVSRKDLLSADEEAELARRIRKGDRAALDRLVRANLLFVVSVAKQYQNNGLELADLISEGSIGLVKAAERFDETRGFKFTTFAVWYIREAITAALTEKARRIRLPHGQVEMIAKIKDAERRIEQREFREATLEDIADELDLTVSAVRDVLTAARRGEDLDDTLGEDSDTTFGDLYSAADDTYADSVLERESDNECLQSAMRAVLSDRDRSILCQSFGIGCEETQQKQIAENLGLSRERVRQLRDNAVASLRGYFIGHRLRPCC